MGLEIRNSTNRVWLGGVALLLALAPGALANPVGFTPIPDDPAAPLSTAAEAINDAGQIVGVANVHPGGPPPNHSFLLSGGVYINFDITATQVSAAFGINNHGLIVGGFEEPVFFGLAYAGTPGATTQIIPPGSAEATAVGVNDTGVIVGNYDTTFRGPDHGFIDNAGSFTTFDIPGADSTSLTGINNKGELAGDYSKGGVTTGFSTDAKGNILLQVPGANVKGINDFGQIVGTIGSSGFVDTDGTITPIDVTGASVTQVTGINDVGQIVGFYSTSSTHSFLADAPPVSAAPEPSSWTIAVFGAGATAWMIRRRRRGSL